LAFGPSQAHGNASNPSCLANSTHIRATTSSSNSKGFVVFNPARVRRKVMDKHYRLRRKKAPRLKDRCSGSMDQLPSQRAAIGRVQAKQFASPPQAFGAA
jgi:hypothetical protein